MQGSSIHVDLASSLRSPGPNDRPMKMAHRILASSSECVAHAHVGIPISFFLFFHFMFLPETVQQLDSTCTGTVSHRLISSHSGRFLP